MVGKIRIQYKLLEYFAVQYFSVCTCVYIVSVSVSLTYWNWAEFILFQVVNNMHNLGVGYILHENI